MDGKPRKYETPFQQPGGIDIPPAVKDQIGDPTVPLFITEGSKKADSAVSAGLCCVSVLGVCNEDVTTGQADWRHGSSAISSPSGGRSSAEAGVRASIHVLLTSPARLPNTWSLTRFARRPSAV
jgi:hypothetical protein